MTVSELITLSLKRIGVVAKGNVIDPELLNDGLSTFNDFVDALATERLTLWSETRTTFPIVANTQDYLVGDGQAVDVARPVFVQQLGDVSPVRLLDTSVTPSFERPLAPMTDQSWRSLPQKSMTAERPYAAYYNPTFPYGTLSLYPVPTGSNLQGVLYAPAAQGQFALGDTILLPPGYRRFLRDGLAVELCPEFDMAVPSALAASAAEAKTNLQRANIRLMDLPIDAMWAGVGARYDIHTDGPR